MRSYLLVPLVAATCSLDGTPAPVREPNPEALAGKLQGVQARMHQRFVAARHIEEAIAIGDLTRAHEEARSIGALAEPDVLPAWKPYFDAVAARSAEIEQAPDLFAAAKRAAQLGRECARCHLAAGAKIAFAVEPRPADDPKRGPSMAAHNWAAIQMWNGLMGPSTERWNAGADALTTVPLTMVAQAVTPTSEVDVDDVAQVRSLARRARTETSPEQRAETFGQLLARCANCHRLLRDR